MIATVDDWVLYVVTKYKCTEEEARAILQEVIAPGGSFRSAEAAVKILAAKKAYDEWVRSQSGEPNCVCDIKQLMSVGCSCEYIKWKRKQA